MTKTRANKIISLVNNLNLDCYKKVELKYNVEKMSISIDHKPSNLKINILLDERDDFKPLLEHEKNSLLELNWKLSDINNEKILDDVEVVKTEVTRGEISNIITVNTEDFILREDIYKFLKGKDITLYSGLFHEQNILELIGILEQPSNKDIVFKISFFTIRVNKNSSCIHD